MAPPLPIHQASVFYPPPWTEEMDHWCISALVKEGLNGNYRVGQHNYSAMSIAVGKVNNAFETNFDVEFGFKRFMHWRVRYRLFKWLTKLSGVVHDPNTNELQTSPDAWEFICEKEPLARAYMVHGEKRYDEFKFLFDEGPGTPDEVHNVDSVEIVDLSTDEDEDLVNAAEVGKGKSLATSSGGRKGKTTNACGDKVLDAATPQSKDKRKKEPAIGEEGVPNNEWWDYVAMGYSESNSGCEVSHESEYSSTEPLKSRAHIEVSKTLGRKLFSEDSSSASFSPNKKF